MNPIESYELTYNDNEPGTEPNPVADIRVAVDKINELVEAYNELVVALRGRNINI